DQRVPASRKFDYSAGMDDGGEDQDAAMQPPSGTAPADEPITPAAPEAQQGSSAAPAGDGGQDEAVPVLDAPEPAPAPSPAAKSPEAAPSTAQSQSPAPAAAPAPAPAAAPASAAANAAAAGGNKDQAHDGAAKDGGAVLYCGSFASSHAAEEQKALLAFQGQRAFVVRRGSSYTLKMGPYKTKAAARAEFSKLDQAGLVSECALEDN
ncbi:MAG: SPOR domain-containing protein, partial [Succinivibrio sp.]